jgi:hypothetical protein
VTIPSVADGYDLFLLNFTLWLIVFSNHHLDLGQHREGFKAIAERKGFLPITSVSTECVLARSYFFRSSISPASFQNLIVFRKDPKCLRKSSIIC